MLLVATNAQRFCTQRAQEKSGGVRTQGFTEVSNSADRPLAETSNLTVWYDELRGFPDMSNTTSYVSPATVAKHWATAPAS